MAMTRKTIWASVLAVAGCAGALPADLGIPRSSGAGSGETEWPSTSPRGGGVQLVVHWPSGASGRVLQALPPSVVRLDLEVRAVDLPWPISARLLRQAGEPTASVVVTVPPGRERILHALAYNAADVLVASASVGELVVEAGRFTPVQVPLVRTVGSLSGLILNSGTSLPEAGAEVRLGDRTALADQAGRFAFADVPAGPYELVVGRAGLVSRTATGSLLAGAATELPPISLSAVWTRQLSPSSNDLKDIQFVDAMRGWAVGVDRILRTMDGGLNWRVSDFSTGYSSGSHGYQSSFYSRGATTLGACRFLDANRGYVAGQSAWGGANYYCGNERQTTGSDPVLLVTTDGGGTWRSAVRRGDMTCGCSCRSSAQDAFGDIWFRDGALLVAGSRESYQAGEAAQSGIAWPAATGFEGAGGGVFWQVRPDGGISYSNNSGKTWAALNVPLANGRVIRLRFADAYRGVAVTQQGALLATVDGGANWRVQRGARAGMSLARFQWGQDSFGWGVDNTGGLWVTHDQLLTLERVIIPDPEARIRGAWFNSPVRGWAVGDGGRIYGL